MDEVWIVDNMEFLTLDSALHYCELEGIDPTWIEREITDDTNS